MKKLVYNSLLILFVGVGLGCSQTMSDDKFVSDYIIDYSEAITGSVVSEQVSSKKKVIDARKVITRQMIEAEGTPLLFVEKRNGRNWTLALFPGENIQETWIGGGGAMLSLYNGELVATRGLGGDLMGASVPKSKAFSARLGASYIKKIRYLTLDNQNDDHALKCKMAKSKEREIIVVFELEHNVSKYTESCVNGAYNIKNEFWQDSSGITIMSKQYHSEAIGYLLIMKLK